MRRIVTFPKVAESALTALGRDNDEIASRMEEFAKFLEELRRPDETLLEAAERALLLHFLAASHGVQSIAAARLGISRRAANYLCRKLGLPHSGTPGNGGKKRAP